MNRYYYFIEETGTITTSTKFYKVSVGSTESEQENLQKLQFLANARKYYFHNVDIESTDFIRRIAKSLAPEGCQFPLFLLHFVLVRSGELLNYLNGNGKLVALAESNQNFHKLMMLSDYHYRSAYYSVGAARHLPSGKRY